MSRWYRPALVAALVLGASLGLPTPAAGALALEWNVPERLRDLNGDGRVDPASLATAAERRRAVRLRVAGAGKCDDRLAWTLDGEAREPTALGDCQFELRLADADAHELELQLGDEKATDVVQARDVLVVSIGDSIASGEGNPDHLGPRWLERRCHRSMQSGAARAAVALERGDRHSAVTFVALGCSGATIEEGLRHRYAGVAPDSRGTLPAQLAELRALARLRPIDAVLLSVGANDVHFAPLVQFCIIQPNCGERRFDPEHPRLQAGKSTAREVVAGAIAALGPMYDRLAADLRSIVNPRRVAVLEYFDPLMAADGEPCPGALGGVGPREVEWARNEVLGPLNAAVRRAAADHHWALVGGVADAFRTHGVCVRGPGRWVVLPGESLIRQWWITGTLHPNAAGHQASAALIVPKLAAILGSYGGAEIAELASTGSGDGGMAWQLLVVAVLVGVAIGAAVSRGFSALRSAAGAVLSSRITSVVAALIAVPLAAGAFFTDAIPVRVPLAGAAVITVVVCWLSWTTSEDPRARTSLAERFGLVVVMLVIAVLAAVSLFVGLAVIVGAIDVNRSEPVPTWRASVGLGLLVAGVTGLVTWWLIWVFRVLFRWRARGWRFGASLALAVLVAGSALWGLSQRSPPMEDAGITIREQARRAGLGRYDLVLMVDPADRASRQLIRAARRHRRAGERMFPTQPGAVSYDLAFGLALPLPAARKRHLWRLVEPPTTHGRELVDSLARLRLSRGPRAAGSYGRLLFDMLSRDRVGWREGAQRGVAFVLESLPSLRQLDRDVRGPVRPRTIPPWAAPGSACGDFISHRLQPRVSGKPWIPVAWGDALARHCRRREQYRAWQRQGRDPDELPREPVALHAVTRETRTPQAVAWWTWARALDGAFHRPRLVSGKRPIWKTNAELLLRDAAKLHTGEPLGRLAKVVRWFRPHLLFDSDEKLRPVDVDWFLSPGTEAKRHQICDRNPGGQDDCEEIDGPAGLVGQLDEYIDLRGTARFFDERPEKQRMYVHVRRSLDRLFLGYWWFLPSNVSPWRPEVTCLPGFAFADATCFDHEADWEGVTVELRVRRRAVLPDQYGLSNLTPKAVIYDFHGVSVRWPWARVDLRADPGSYATHPVVYVAKGSHASYPAGCASTRCNQRLGGKGLGEGRFDGRVDWRYNDQAECYPPGSTADGATLQPCLLALPSTRDGRFGVRWNAFQGRWGAATCVGVAKACTQTDGPASPARQRRFRTPGKTRAGDIRTLEDFQAKYAGRRSDSPRWPPDPWPPRGRGPATPAITPAPPQ